VFNTREIINSKDEVVTKVRNQLYFHLVLYLFLIPLALVSIFGLEFIQPEYILIFILLSISEHLGQEIFRLLTSLERSLTANVLLFLKSGVWIWYVLFDFFILGNDIDLFKYMIVWVVSSWGSLLIGVFIIKRFLKIVKWKMYKPDIPWIIKGLKTSSIFFMSSLSFLVIQFSDRFMIDFFHGKILVGVYTTYAQFINAIDVFTFSGIIMITYPKLIKHITNKKAYNQLRTKFFNKLLATSIVLIAGSYFIAPYIFEFLEKPSFMNFIETYNILLIGIFFLVMSNVFHYDLYAKKKDRLLLKIAAVGMCLNIILNMILIPKFEIFGASLATLSSFFFIFLTKFYFSRQKTKIVYDNI